jgi:hypothetical protein
MALEDGSALLYDSYGHLRSRGKVTGNKARVLMLDNPKNPVNLRHKQVLFMFFFQQYIESNKEKGERGGFLLTVGDYTYAVWQ